MEIRSRHWLLALSRQATVRAEAAEVPRSVWEPAASAGAMAMLERANPMPPFPPEMTQSQLTITVPIGFNLR